MPPRSKIAKLPDEIRKWLHQTLIQRKFGDILPVTAELQELLRQAGIAVYIGKSAVGAESLKVKRAQETIQATTEAAKLIAETSRDDTDARGEAVMALISSDMFEALLLARESEATEDPLARLAIMSEAATAAARLSRASVSQRQWRTEVETRVKAAADAVQKLAKQGGMDPHTVAEIRASILGIVKRDAPTPAPNSAG